MLPSLVAFVLLATTPQQQRAVVDPWMAKLEVSSAALKSGDAARSLELTDRILADMRHRLGPGKAAEELMGIVLSHRALALAGLGRQEEALWWWQAVLSMDPRFAKSDLTAFGAAGAFLTANRELRDWDAADDENDPTITPPKVRKRVQPEFPYGAYYFGIEGTLVVQMIIDKEGNVREPRVVKSLPAPILTYEGLRALQRWKFHPAVKDGQPVDTIFNLSINYKAD